MDNGPIDASHHEAISEGLDCVENLKHGVHVAGASQVVETNVHVLGINLFGVVRQLPEDWEDELVEESATVFRSAVLVEEKKNVHEEFAGLLSLTLNVVFEELWLFGLA